MLVAMPAAMGSPDRQYTSLPRSDRAHSIVVNPAIDARGAIRKRSSTSNSILANNINNIQQIERRHQAAFNHIAESKEQAIPAAGGSFWITPQHSPQPDAIFDEPSALDSFPHWTAPTPPHSDSGVPPLTLDTHDGLVATPCLNAFSFDHSTASVDMSSSLGFLLPQQYGSGFEGEDYPMGGGYQIPPVRLSQSTSSSGTPAYAQTGSSSPSKHQSRMNPSSAAPRRQADLPPAAMPPPFSSSSSAEYSATSGPPMPSIGGVAPSTIPSPHLSGPSFHSQSRSPQLYESSGHPQSQPPFPHHMSQSSFSTSSPGDLLTNAGESPVRVMNQRPKPQCWEHGCNGRQFSTFSNLLRHQREKSGTAAKSYCPKCGAEFTRTTARNGHLAHDKCTKAPGQGSDEAN